MKNYIIEDEHEFLQNNLDSACIGVIYNFIWLSEKK